MFTNASLSGVGESAWESVSTEIVMKSCISCGILVNTEVSEDDQIFCIR